MNQLMNNDETRCVKPFLAIYEAEIVTPIVDHPVEYDEDRMLLVIDGQPALLRGAHTDMKATKVTFVRQETTDDE